MRLRGVNSTVNMPHTARLHSRWPDRTKSPETPAPRHSATPPAWAHNRRSLVRVQPGPWKKPPLIRGFLFRTVRRARRMGQHERSGGINERRRTPNAASGLGATVRHARAGRLCDSTSSPSRWHGASRSEAFGGRPRSSLAPARRSRSSVAGRCGCSRRPYSSSPTALRASALSRQSRHRMMRPS